MPRYIQLDITGRTKGRPPKWVPSFMKRWFTWDETKTVHTKIPLDDADLTHDVEILGAYITIDVEDGTELLIGAEYAGLSKNLVDVKAKDGKWSIDTGSVGGFSATGTVALVTV